MMSVAKLVVTMQSVVAPWIDMQECFSVTSYLLVVGKAAAYLSGATYGAAHALSCKC